MLFNACKLLVFLSFILPSTIFSQWSTANLSSARSLGATTASGTKVYHGGGAYYPSNSVRTIIDIYNTESKVWSTGGLSQGRFNLAAAATEGYVLFGGGVKSLSTAAVTSRVDIYDIDGDTWSTSSLSLGRGALVATANENVALFAGGIRNYASTITTSRVDIFHQDSLTWTTAELSQPRGYLTAVSAENKAYFAGGILSGSGNTAVVTNRIDIYDYVTGVWKVDSLSIPRGGLAAASAGGKILFAGGHNSSYSPLNIVDIFDITTNNWSTDTLSQARGELTAVSLYSKIYFAGGYSNYNSLNMSAQVDIYDTETGLWTTTQLSKARSELSSASAGDALLICGGGSYGGNKSFNAVDIYTDESTGIVKEKTSGMNFQLHQNYPNPFNPETSIEYRLSTASDIVLSVYSIFGEKIKILKNEFLAAGIYKTEWDGRNEHGIPVSSGMYIFELKINNNKAVYLRKGLLLK